MSDPPNFTNEHEMLVRDMSWYFVDRFGVLLLHPAPFVS